MLMNHVKSFRAGKISIRPSVVAIALLTPSVILGAVSLNSPAITAGKNLETAARIILSEAAPNEGLQITITSNNPDKLLLSTGHASTESRNISVNVSAGFSKSPEFFVHALDNTGTATYTASAPGYESSTGTVAFAPSGFVVAGPSQFGNPIATVTGAAPSKIRVYSALLDASGDFVGVQPLRRGLSVVVAVTSSSTKVGMIAASPLTIAADSSGATTEFQPVGPGETILTVSVPPGFSTPTRFAAMKATVRTPGIGLLDEVSIGENLQISGYVALGRPAPPEGLAVTLTSNNPNELLVSTGAANLGSASSIITVPAGGVGAVYYLQALSKSGTATYTASAPGYMSRTATVMLTPSGVLLGLLAPPDEAELFRKEAAEEPHGFVASLSRRAIMPVMVYTAQLHPIHHRAADITVQPLRAGLSLTVTLDSSNPTVGTIESSVTIAAGSKEGRAQFTALSTGSTVVSVATPKGFTTSGNATSMTVLVQQ